MPRDVYYAGATFSMAEGEQGLQSLERWHSRKVSLEGAKQQQHRPRHGTGNDQARHGRLVLHGEVRDERDEAADKVGQADGEGGDV